MGGGIEVHICTLLAGRCLGPFNGSHHAMLYGAPNSMGRRLCFWLFYVTHGSFYTCNGVVKRRCFGGLDETKIDGHSGYRWDGWFDGRTDGRILGLDAMTRRSTAQVSGLAGYLLGRKAKQRNRNGKAYFLVYFELDSSRSRAFVWHPCVHRDDTRVRTAKSTCSSLHAPHLVGVKMCVNWIWIRPTLIFSIPIYMYCYM